ncbi:MAG: hypothetical protein HN786_05680 [Cellvibrionales bacterium]|jgi:hypothetical protein|nr:hypothetical protein [Cellvibrionales bacterium]
MKNKLIGISGFARSGKDTFYQCCKEVITDSSDSVVRYSFADALKEELDDLLLKHTGISAFATKDSEKKIIRPLLVTYGTEIRRKLNPNCWIDKINFGVDYNLQNDKYVFITDVRFLNEAQWVKSKGGVLINMHREGIGPANKDESEQYELFKSLIDYKISWPTFDKDFPSKCAGHILQSGFFEQSDIEKKFQTEPAK